MNNERLSADEKTTETPLIWTEESMAETVITLKNKGDIDGLEKFFDARLKDDSIQEAGKGKLWNEFGVLKIQQEKFEEAKLCFQNAIQIEPGHISAQYNLATFAMQEGDLKTALELYRAILKQHPDHFKALYNAGLCCNHMEDRETAHTMLTRAARVQPENSDAQYVAGEALLQAGKASDSLPYFRAASKSSPDHFEINLGLAIALLASKEYDEAIKICDEALMKFGPAVLPLQLKGDAWLAKEIPDKALECHSDLCMIDLDIREFVVTRIQKLEKENPELFIEYRELAHEKYPDFASIMGASLKKN